MEHFRTWEEANIYFGEKALKGAGGTFLQHKGSDICIDIICTCGRSFHIDGDFCYTVQCPRCKQLFALGCSLEVVAIEQDNDGCGARQDYEALDAIAGGYDDV